MIDPKADFKKFMPVLHGTLRAEIQNPWFKTSVTYALAQLASEGATAQELNGANRLVEILGNLAADEPVVKRFPVKELEFLDGPKKKKDDEKKDAK